MLFILKLGSRFDMSKFALDTSREQSRGEEIANTISHAVALVAIIVGTPFLIWNAVQEGDAGFVVGASIFAASAILLYLASTVYHALQSGKVKQIFRTLDHSAIFLLIAGTYTPFTLGVLSGAWGWTLFGIVWGLAAIGVAMKAFKWGYHPLLSTGLYLSMGWLVVIAINPLLEMVPTEGLMWLLAGGLFYTVGVIFYATDSRLKYGHSIWHFFVMGGTGCHYFAILWYAA
ncbi:hemolysin III family protein [Thiomicrorhabdus sp. HH1]|uniref:Hemolysin III family protein n=2 Tax=Piscirickettsiaceae TaxID=135616 RepID=A0ABS0BZD1_9GAMM|nr:hemolysin III family protein [Thiomicrorhabdus heinhorstiae]